MIREDNKRLVILISTIVGFLIVVAIALILFFTQQNNNQPGIQITNYDKYVTNLDGDEKVAIERALYYTVELNLPESQDIEKINDATIREDTYRQSEDNRIYTTSFIVDIESIKQSYEIKDTYSRLDPEESGLYDYTVLALCLTKDKLKYGEFVCQDRISQEKGVSEADPILQYLPHSTLDYTLKQDINSKDLKLIAEITLNEIDYRLGEEAAISRYKAELQKWFESKNLNSSDYQIVYEY